jgi:hypothetical protein
MNDSCVTGWSSHQLRLAFYDFAIRGEGGRQTVAAVIREWADRGALDSAATARWLDALEWREAGGWLPGWVIPQGPSENPVVPGEEHEALFEQWRGQRYARAA